MEILIFFDVFSSENSVTCESANFYLSYTVFNTKMEIVRLISDYLNTKLELIIVSVIPKKTGMRRAVLPQWTWKAVVWCNGMFNLTG